MKNILFIAPPAGGKGTQSARLVETFGYVHISTGDLLRKIDKSTKLGQMVTNLLKEGKFISDEIVLELLKNELLKLKPTDKFILDGFPRNLNQAKMLDVLLEEQGLKIDIIICLDVPYDVLLKRVVGRMSCESCHKIYNEYFMPPKTLNKCDVCGSLLSKRSDDTESIFAQRYNTYLKETEPIINYYRESGILKVLDGNDNTFEKIVSVIEND